MKVMCINNKKPLELDRMLPKHWILEGEVYTVKEEFLYEQGRFYGLAERDYGKDGALYNSNRFIPLSKIDERKMATSAREKSLINEML